jgi:outer membrane lipoprotein-sorting protein
MTPRNGLEVIGAMRHAYPSRSLRSLSFTVTTTDHRADPARVAASRTYARLPGKFRVARLPVNSQSGFVRDRHLMAVFEDGERVTTLRRVDLATLLAYDVFAQSIDTTIMWLDSARVRFGLARRDYLDDRNVWVVGAREGDTTSAQFWVDADEWRVVRVIQRDPRSPDDILDVRFTEFTARLNVPVPLHTVTYRNGRLAYSQRISQLAINPRLSSSQFSLSRWRTSARSRVR